MKEQTNKKHISMLCSFIVLIFAVMMLVLSTNANALDDRIDISIDEPIIIIQGEERTQAGLTTSLYYGNLALSGYGQITNVELYIPSNSSPLGTVSATSMNWSGTGSSTSIPTNRNLVEGQYSEGTLKVTYIANSITL